MKVEHTDQDDLETCNDHTTVTQNHKNNTFDLTDQSNSTSRTHAES